MQLICPKCEASVDVEDEGEPDKRRPVRCPSCNESWFTGGKTDLYALSFTKPSEIEPEVARILQEEAAQEMSARKLENEAALQKSADPTKEMSPQGDPEPVTSDDMAKDDGYVPLNKRQHIILFLLAVPAGLTGLFIFAPQIVERFPESADWVFSYVFWVNDMRAVLSGLMVSSQDFITSLDLGGILRSAQVWLGDSVNWIKDWVSSFSES